MKSKMMNRVVCVSGAVLCAVLLGSIANASTSWSSVGPLTMFGFTGAIRETATMSGISNLVNQSTPDTFFPFAVAKTYSTSGGSLTIKTSDSADDGLFFTVHNSPFFYVEAQSVTFGSFPNHSGDSSLLSAHTFSQAQAQLVCPNETFSSSIDLESAAFGASEAVATPYCPEGGFPVTAKGIMWHGVR